MIVVSFEDYFTAVFATLSLSDSNFQIVIGMMNTRILEVICV